MRHAPSPKQANSNPAKLRHAESNWEAARQAILQLLRPQLTGKHWIQLSEQPSPLLPIQTAEHGSLWVEVIETDNNKPKEQSDSRLTTFCRNSADGIICDQLIQSHPQPDRIIKEIQQLLRSGGWVMISGAGSIRGKQAAGTVSQCIRPQQIAALLESSSLKLVQCYTHANQAPQTLWQRRIEQFRFNSRSLMGWHLPSLLPLLCRHANTRPGWVMLFKDKTLGMTPLASPLKSRSIKLQPNSAISLCDPHRQQTQSAEPAKPSIFTTRAA